MVEKYAGKVGDNNASAAAACIGISSGGVGPEGKASLPPALETIPRPMGVDDADAAVGVKKGQHRATRIATLVPSEAGEKCGSIRFLPVSWSPAKERGELWLLKILGRHAGLEGLCAGLLVLSPFTPRYDQDRRGPGEEEQGGERGEFFV